MHVPCDGRSSRRGSPCDVAGGPESLEGLRGILTGGGPLPEPLRRRCVAGGLPIAVTYGLTEACSQVATAAPGTEAVRALEGVDLRIAGPEADGVGEIVVRGPMVMKGYLDDEDATRGALRGGWLHTGDLGRLSADGSLTVAGRRTDLVVTGGENVYPVEVERVLERHPGIAEVAVFGLPDHEWGERVVAAIVPSRGMLDAQELTEWCRGHLAAFKVPREIRMVPALPRSPSGKLRRTDLATLA
jgi:acyl-CoA synthetase (AMP-forming)/AMP-acid ligase II